MKRMMLLASLIMVFSLFTAAAAIAGPGPGAGEGEPVGETVMTQAQERVQVHAEEAPCVAGGEAPECEQVRARTQAREQIQNQVREDDGTCVGTAAECEAVRDPIQARDRDRDQNRTSDGACTEAGTECEPAREMTRTEAYERIMERVAAYVDGNGEGGYLFAMVRRIWTHMHMHGPLSAMFL